MAPFGTFRHWAMLDAPGEVQPDPDGGWTDAFVPLDPPAWACAIRPATAADLETIASGTVIGQAAHVARGRFHKGITLKTRLTVRDPAGLVHVMSVIAYRNPDLRCLESELVCTEVLDAG